MNYNILEARIEFKENLLHRITVLVDYSSNTNPFSDVRAVFATTKPRGGYMHITSSAKVSESLLQEVAAFGLETVDRDEIFPKWRTTYESQHQHA